MAAVGDRRAGVRRLASIVVALTAAACGRGAPATSASVDVRAALAPLHAFEEARRASTDFAHPATSDRSLGEDPYVVRALPVANRFVGVLRGADAIVVLDADLREIQRLPAPARPTAIAIDKKEIVVAGEESAWLQRYRVEANGTLTVEGRIDLAGTYAVRDVAFAPDGAIQLVEERRGRLITLRPRDDGTFTHEESFVGLGAIRLVRTERFAVVDALLDHAVVVRAFDGTPDVKLTNDGPLWSIDAREIDDVLWVVAGGVEDHPLDRHPGFFGYIDSFVYVWRVEKGVAQKISATNVSALGVVVPKAIALRENAGKTSVEVIGSGSEHGARIEWSESTSKTPSTSTFAFPPGGSSLAFTADGAHVVADPLLDAWVIDRGGTPRIVRTANPTARVTESWLGEALLFTTMMAPWDTSDDAHSRFTCETCHFEGYTDGRVHHTGREEIHAVTKPLLGLFANRPYFTRGLDPDLTTVAHNEFRVAGAGSGHDPWFALDPDDHPWLREIGLEKAVSADRLRLSFVAFLMDFNHAPNPAVLGRDRFDDVERRGAEVFRDRCASCHAPRLVTDDAHTTVAFENWEASIFDPAGAIVWARDGYEKTGIEPYVHPQGARTSSLRRLFKKHPYFTNGSAPDLESVVAGARFTSNAFFHAPLAAPPDAQSIAESDRAALVAFLSLL